MSFCSKVKIQLCRAAEGDGSPAFCCGLLFTHAGRRKPYLLRTEIMQTLPILEAGYESICGEPLPVTVAGSDGYTRRYKLKIAERGALPTKNRPRSLMTIAFREPADESRAEILTVLGCWHYDGRELRLNAHIADNPELLKSFISGVFVGCGLAGDPEDDYHLEFCGLTDRQADELVRLLLKCDFHPSVTRRGERWSVYFKDGDQMEYLLGYLGDNDAMFELSNLRIERDMRNRLNRQLNCDSANLVKSRAAADRQLADIKYIFERDKSEYLSEELLATARARLENEDFSLSELGKLLGVGRSGVNHRLGKISAIAADLRQKE